MHSHFTIQTPSASKYLQQFCKHFAHKLVTEFSPEQGHVMFGEHRCDLKAQGDALTITVTAPTPEEVTRLKGVVESHLVRFMFREPPTITWADAA